MTHSLPTRRSSDLLSLSLTNYAFDLMDGGGWDSYYNSIQMALLTAVVGTVVVFVGAYVVEKTRGFETGRRSEEHTSELQSLMRNSYAVFCLKKKKTTSTTTQKNNYIQQTTN